MSGNGRILTLPRLWVRSLKVAFYNDLLYLPQVVLFGYYGSNLQKMSYNALDSIFTSLTGETKCQAQSRRV